MICYFNHRNGEAVNLRNVLSEEYVSRNARPAEIHQILENPRLIETAHEKLREDFSSGRLDPRFPRGGAR